MCRRSAINRRQQRLEQPHSQSDSANEAQPATNGNRPPDQGRDDQQRTGTADYVEERWEKPRATGIWLTVALFFLACAVTAAFAAVGLAEEVQVQSSELWIISAAFASLAVMALFAHVDVNRGRKPRVIIVKRKPTEND